MTSSFFCEQPANSPAAAIPATNKRIDNPQFALQTSIYLDDYRPPDTFSRHQRFDKILLEDRTIRKRICAALLVTTLAAPSFAQVILPTSKQFATAQAHLSRIVRSKLRDPSSAQFKPQYICTWSPSSKIAVGKVNAKNAFGGYASCQRFVIAETDGDAQVTFTQNANSSGTDADDLPKINKKIAASSFARNFLLKCREKAVAAGVPVS